MEGKIRNMLDSRAWVAWVTRPAANGKGDTEHLPNHSCQRSASNHYQPILLKLKAAKETDKSPRKGNNKDLFLFIYLF